MTKPLVFSLPGQEDLAEKLTQHLDGEAGYLITHRFPDGETYLRVESECRGREVILLGSLFHPDEKILPLLLLAETLRDLGVKSIRLVSPYLAYMRQDKQFQKGEGVTSRYFARLLSNYFNGLVTVNPHLHRYHALSEIYSIPSQVVDAGEAMGQWIQAKIKKPLLVGPDGESEQWVASIAQGIGAPYGVGQKVRHGDREVTSTFPDLTAHAGCQVVLIDDIISTGVTLVHAMKHLKEQGFKNPVCLGIHALFAEGAEEALHRAGAREVVTANTIPHHTNGIDISGALARALGGE